MLKWQGIENWLRQHIHLDEQADNNALIKVQNEQAYARLGFAASGLLYLSLHATDFAQFITAFLTVTGLYFISTLISLAAIRHKPMSRLRIVLFPLFDIFVVSFGMLIDGGQSSGIYFIYLVIIFGNSFRFGNVLLLCSQAASLIGLLSMSAYAHLFTALASDLTLLLWQVTALVVIPLYVYLIGQKAEEALKEKNEAEETSLYLLNNGPMPVFTFEPDTHQTSRIMYVNTALNDLFQQQHGHLIGQPVDNLSLPEDQQEMLAFCQTTLNQQHQAEKNSAQSIYIRGKDKDGNILKLMCTAISMRWRKRHIGVCFLYDITQRETMQEELESVHRHVYMSTLVAGIVHDFRNVLTNMIGYAEVLQMNSANEAEKQQLEAIIAAGDRGSDLITHLLKLATNSPQGNIPSHTLGTQLTQPLENIIGLARLQLPKHIQLICCIDEPLHDVAISITEIEQILLNLINNSSQAITEGGQIGIQIRNDAMHRLSSPKHPSLCIQVSDNGSGIAEHEMDNIFKPFWTSRSGQGGSGLGLSMVQRIIKRNHGSIEVTSIAHQETCFSIHIPPHITQETEQNNTQPEQQRQTENNTASESQALTQASHYHVLVVDDVPDILNIHQAMLARMQHSSETAASGIEALALFRQENSHFDLIITDYRMPKMDGLKLVKHIRQHDANIPILMITAFGEDEHLLHVRDYQVNLVNKPLSMDKFKEAIAATMAAANKQTEAK